MYLIVVGLDAEGIQDLVQDSETGLLLPLPTGEINWSITLNDPSAPLFDVCAKGYAELLAKVVVDNNLRKSMGDKGCTDGIKGFTWWDTMEKCVDGYREAIQMTIDKNDTAGGGKASQATKWNMHTCECYAILGEYYC